MPTYHFVDKEDRQGIPSVITGITRVITEHKTGQFRRAQCYSQPGEAYKQMPTLLLKDCGGSLILADVIGSMNRKLSKIHIGKLLIRNPHAEVYRENGAEGPRVDLHWVDVRYARERLAELVSWRNPAHVAALLKKYSSPPVCDWYSTDHRKRQLKISQEGLEGKIDEMSRTVEILSKQVDCTFVSDSALSMEQLSSQLIVMINDAVSQAETERQLAIASKDPLERLTNTQQRQPKFLQAPQVLELCGQVYSLLVQVLDFIALRAEERVQESDKYWDEVDSWEKM